MTIDQHSDGTFGTKGPRAHQHYMMNHLKLFDAKVSINHWQLRNCITADTLRRGSVYYIFDHSIRELDTRTLEDSPSHRKRRHRASFSGFTGTRTDYHSATQAVVEFPFKPRSFNELNGLVVCGGHMGNDDNGYVPSRGTDVYNQAYASVEDQSFDVQPITINDSNILSDQTTYSNTRSWKGIVSVYNRRTNLNITRKLGQYINNCVELFEHSNSQFNLYTCNNDGHLYQCEINNSDFLLKRRFADLKFALNNAAISHNGSLMCVTGDSNKFALYKKNALSDVFTLNYDNLSGKQSEMIGSNCQQKHKRIPRYALNDSTSYVDHIFEVPGADNGFFTSFSENDMMMATVFQNGNCCVYDVRNMEEPLTQIHTTRSQGSVPQSGAFRICKFSEGMEDLLFISEHQQRVHVVDTRNFMNRQVIMVPYKYKNTEFYETEGQDSSTYYDDSENWHEPGLRNPSNRFSERRRTSEPSNTRNPFITAATRLPIQQLQPTILPYSSISDSTSGLDESVSDSEDSAIVDYDVQDLINGTGSTESRSRQRIHSDSNFTVRRYSTSSTRRPSILVDENTSGSTPSNAGQNTLEENSTRTSNMNFNADGLESRSSIDQLISGTTTTIPGVRSFGQMHIRPLFRRPRGNFSGNTPEDFNEDKEECNISGIEWLQDEEGSSLVIGTDYGIIKWNINYWARRSFPSYDFC